MYYLVQCFFRFWNVNVNVPWTFSTIRSKALLRYDSNVPKRSWPFNVPDRSPFLTVTKSVPERSWAFAERSGTLRNAQERSGRVMVTVRNGHGNGQERWTVNGQGRWTVMNDHTLQDKRSETFAKSRSRYVHVHVSKTKETLYFLFKF